MRMEVDISDYTIGEVLSMKYEDRRWMLWLKTQSVKSTKEPCIGLTQESLIEFLVKCIYFIYTS